MENSKTQCLSLKFRKLSRISRYLVNFLWKSTQLPFLIWIGFPCEETRKVALGWKVGDGLEARSWLRVPPARASWGKGSLPWMWEWAGVVGIPVGRDQSRQSGTHLKKEQVLLPTPQRLVRAKPGNPKTSTASPTLRLSWIFSPYSVKFPAAFKNAFRFGLRRVFF